MKFLILVPLFFLAACQDNSGISTQQMNAASPDKVTYQIYSQFMETALGSALTGVNNNTNLRKGDSNPYRKGYPGFSHKALAACVAWDANAVTARLKVNQSVASDDWDYAAVRALTRCEDHKRERNLLCDCQLVDHDDINVLMVPDDYWAAYERKYGSTKKQ